MPLREQSFAAFRAETRNCLRSETSNGDFSDFSLGTLVALDRDVPLCLG